MFLEGRILGVVYRLNFSSDIFGLLNFIKNGKNLYLDFKPNKLVNRVVRIGELITVSKKLR
jgi:hypothetical protein